MIHNLNKTSQEDVDTEMSQEEALVTIRRVAAPYLIYGEDDPRNLYTIWDEPVETEVLDVL